MKAEELQAKIQESPHDLKKDPLKRAERGDPTAPLPGAYRRAIAEVLELPEAWFYSPLEDLLATGVAESTPGQVDRIEAMLEQLLTEDQLEAADRAWREQERGREGGSDVSESPA
jgi:hypothetical protein